MSSRPEDPPRSRAQPLMAPWRLSYMDMLSSAEARPAPPPSPASQPAAPPKPKPACFLREYWLAPERDQANHIIVRTGLPSRADQPEGSSIGGLIMLNKYPYSNGHLLVCLGESRPRLLDYSERQRAELWSLTDLAVRLVERGLNPQGVNVGLNQGMAAGAGVPEHVHVHVVPRWSGDVNFMEVCASVRVIPSALEDMARRLRDVWDVVRREDAL